MHQRYPELYSYLNPHLFSQNASEGVKEILIDFVYPPFETFSISRDSPRISAFESELKKKLKEQYSDRIFTPHTVRYLKNFLITQNRGGEDQSKQTKEKSKVSCSKKKNTFFHAKTLWAHNYYHFLTETIPAILWFLEESEVREPEKAIILCHSTAFSKQALEWFGIENPTCEDYPDEEIIWNPVQGEYMITQRIIHSQPINECGAPSLQKYRLLRKRVTEKLFSSSSLIEKTIPKKVGILLERKANSVRRILNHPEVWNALQKFFPEIEWVLFNVAKSFAHTAELFSRASVIIGAHGAGMTNTLFSPAGTTVIEFMPLNLPNLCYWHQSEMLGHVHHIIPCKDEGNYAMNADIPLLEKILKGI